MRISTHVNVKNPKLNQFPYLEAVRSYLAFSEEVVVVDGGSTDGSTEEIQKLSKAVKIVNYEWPDNWLWDQLAYSTKVGYDNCNGDWAIKMDLDYIIHDNDYKELRTQLERLLSHTAPVLAATFNKSQFITVDRYFSKARTHLAINKRDWGDKVTYGVARDKDPDFMWAIMKEGETRGSRGAIPYGTTIQDYEGMLYKVGVPILCYDLTFMTKERLEQSRPAYYIAKERYYYPHKKEIKIREIAPDMSMNILERQFQSRKESKTHIPLALNGHPSNLHGKIKGMTEDMFGYKAFGWLGDNYKAVYFKL